MDDYVSVSRPSPPSLCKSYCGHNHDPSGSVSRAAEDAVPTEFIDQKMEDIGRWTRAGVKAGDIFKLLEMDQDGKVLCRDGKKKVSFGEVVLGNRWHGMK